MLVLNGEQYKVIDGDTFDCEFANGMFGTIRLIGIDSPETHYNKQAKRAQSSPGTISSGKSAEEIIKLGLLAKEYAQSLLPVETSVTLEIDVETKDKYDRILAYVYLPNRIMINGYLIQKGYANTMTISPNVRYREIFTVYEKEARENLRGLWKY